MPARPRCWRMPTVPALAKSRATCRRARPILAEDQLGPRSENAVRGGDAGDVRADRTDATLGYKPVTARAWSCTMRDLGGSCCGKPAIEAACGADQSSRVDHGAASGEDGNYRAGYVRFGLPTTGPFCGRHVSSRPGRARAASGDGFARRPSVPEEGRGHAGSRSPTCRSPQRLGRRFGFASPGGSRRYSCCSVGEGSPASRCRSN